MPDTVGFGATTTILPAELADAKKVLEAAVQAEGDEVLTEWEENFAKSALDQLTRLKHRWDLSDSRKDAIERIRGKLEKEGLL